MFYRIEMLKAGTGDCFWIECGEISRKTYRIVIDGGNDHDTIIMRLKQTTSSSPIDLWIVTHTDEDHIAGVLNLASVGDVREVWFNAPEPDASGGNRTLSYRQGNELVTILLDERRKHHTVWTHPVQTRPDDKSEPLKLPNGRLKLLGPTPEVVAELLQDWESNTLGERARRSVPVRRVALDDDTVERLAAEADKKPDTKITNRSSIIVAIEFDIEGKDEPARYLFAGDAPAAAVLDAVRTLKGTSERLKLDGFKLSHHGSTRSVSKALFEALDCQEYYISTNGNKHGLPNDPAIAKAIVHGRARKVFFNYEQVGRRWFDYAAGSKRRVDIQFPQDGPDAEHEPDHIVVAEHEFQAPLSEVWYAQVSRPIAPSLEHIEIIIGPAEKSLKMVLKQPRGADLVWEVAANPVHHISELIREGMDRLAKGWPVRDRFERDLTDIATLGRDLFFRLFERSSEAVELLRNAEPKTSIVVRCHRDLSVPFGLIHPPGELNPQGFWAYRYSISTPFDENAPTAAVMLELLSFIGCQECDPPFPPEFGAPHVEWRTLDTAWRNMTNCLNHFYCHNRGDGGLSTRSGAMPLTPYHLSSIAHERAGKGPDVLFLNACDTRELREFSEWEWILTHKPFYGFIGTEALVHYQAALDFALAFFRQLREGADLHEAFDKTLHLMWPASLFYGMYLQPAFARAAKLAPAGERK